MVNKLQDGTSVTHALQGQVSNHADTGMQQHLQEFFDKMSGHAVPRATRIVRQHVVGAKDDQVDDRSDSDADDQVIESLRDSDINLVKLPPSFTKRGMYKGFLLEHLGWKIKWDSTGRVQSTTPVDGMEQVKPIPSWGTFVGYWKEARSTSPR